MAGSAPDLAGDALRLAFAAPGSGARFWFTARLLVGRMLEMDGPGRHPADGMDGFLSEPVRLEALHAAVRLWCRSGAD